MVFADHILPEYIHLIRLCGIEGAIKVEQNLKEVCRFSDNLSKKGG